MQNVYVPKQDQRLPDGYGVQIEFVNGKKEELEFAQHTIIDYIIIKLPNGHNRIEPNPCPVLEYCTVDDLWGTIPIGSIQKMTFDKRFSKIVDIKEEHRRKREEELKNVKV